MANPYKFPQSGPGVIRVADGAMIPPDSRNTDYNKYLADGGVAVTDPADPPPLKYSENLYINPRIRTTDATPTEVWRTTLHTLTGYTSILTLIGVDSGNGAVRIIRASVGVKRLNAGALMIGAPVVIANHADAAASTWNIGAAVDVNDFVVTVTGAAGRIIDWSLTGTIQSFTPAGA